jgi:hypothetical protein
MKGWYSYLRDTNSLIALKPEGCTMPEQRTRTKAEALRDLRDKIDALCNARDACERHETQAKHETYQAGLWAKNAQKLESEVEDVIGELAVDGWLSILAPVDPDEEITLAAVPPAAAEELPSSPERFVEADYQDQRAGDQADSGIDLARDFGDGPQAAD